MDEKWEWFCGRNSVYIDNGQGWFDDVRNNTCLLDGVAALPHGVFLLVHSILLLFIGCCTNRRVYTRYLLVYPGHSLRWLLSALLLVLILASAGEGVMTDDTYKEQPTQPHLYVHSIVAFVAVVSSLVYYHHMEQWQLPGMSVVLLVYWTCCAGVEIFRLMSLTYQEEDDIQRLIFDLTIVKLVIYLVLLCIEANIIRTKVASDCSSDIILTKSDHLLTKSAHIPQ